MLTSFNRGMGALAQSMGRRGVGYVIVLSLLVLFGGAAGMYQFENPGELSAQGFPENSGGIASYSDSVWWTAMLMTTIGSQYWPLTSAGRALCFLISLFSLGVFGYITASLASFFVDTQPAPNTGKTDTELKNLRDEIAALRKDIKK